MLLAIDVGNTNIVYGLFDGPRLVHQFRVETSRGRTETVRTTKFDVSNRGNRGQTIISKGTLKAATADPVELHLPGRA